MREVEHGITVGAPAGAVYRLVADVGNWPRVFPPTLHVDHLGREGDEERIRIWATANGEAKSWTSRRSLDPDALRIRFRQEVSSPPVASMGGSWVIEPLTPDTSRVRLLHDYRAVGDDPAGLEWIERAVDRNSRAELAALKAHAERAGDEREFSFEDTVHIEGAAEDAYAFVDEAHLWERRLPHVAAVRLTEDVPGLQRLRMDTVAKDGSTHTTESFRVCFPHDRIVYKQVTLPALMSLHTGYWTFRPAADGRVAATSQHTVVIDTANIAAVLGPRATLADARSYVRDALGANSRATLGHAKAYAESRR
ncbi:aromatase/cyclase [Streptomyces caatingaensis]|uniref:Cyclase n=1 Tax=Streptomyces caatingaensis TaxID=1678637 RepID=A0A0K9XFI2_9ACTN|nr:aromatase/cyclase [Streptomyces caatingaensis]KNB52159.1 cyclase [Streptomyces caatingaensis]